MIKTIFVLGLFFSVSIGYVIKPTALFTIGHAEPDQYLWQPSHPVSIQPGVVALRVSKSPDGCGANCPSAALLFRESGESSIIPFDDFCGSGGLIKGLTVQCFANDARLTTDGVFASKTVLFSLSEETISKTASPDAIFHVGDVSAEYLRAVNNVVFFAEKNTYGASAELKLTNGSVAHGFFRSEDGEVWNFTSFVPFPVGKITTSHRVGDTKVIVLSGSSGNFTSATSVFMGSRWEKVEPASYVAPLSSWASRFTTIYGGIRGRPGVGALASGSKKGSEKAIDIPAQHNKLVFRQQEASVFNFSAEFQQATQFECLTEPFSSDPADGCSSSSFVAVAPANATQATTENVTYFYLFYDKLDNGFAPATKDKGSSIHAIKLQLNETKEDLDYQAKLEEKRLEAEREKVREEARKKAQQEAEERKRRDRREKIRKDKARRAQFDEMDRVNIQTALDLATLDGEMIVVRDVDPDFTDIEKDTFFF